MQKYVRKRVKSVPAARLRPLTTQIAADLVPSVKPILHGHFAHWRRCKDLPLKGYKKNADISCVFTPSQRTNCLMPFRFEVMSPLPNTRVQFLLGD